MEKQLLEAARKNQELAKDLKKRWVKGDSVRVLKSLECNTYYVMEYLGQVCKVEYTRKHVGIFNKPKIEYILRLGDRLEPFWEEELDGRFKSNCR